MLYKEYLQISLLLNLYFKKVFSLISIKKNSIHLYLHNSLCILKEHKRFKIFVCNILHTMSLKFIISKWTTVWSKFCASILSNCVFFKNIYELKVKRIMLCGPSYKKVFNWAMQHTYNKKILQCQMFDIWNELHIPLRISYT